MRPHLGRSVLGSRSSGVSCSSPAVLDGETGVTSWRAYSSLKSISTLSVLQVFYYKMKGDYHRYIAEYKVDAEKAKSSEAAKQAYIYLPRNFYLQFMISSYNFDNTTYCTFQGSSSSGTSHSNRYSRYTAAMGIAEKGLLVTHPIRLGLALNFSV